MFPIIVKTGYPCMNIYLRRMSKNHIRCNRTAMKKSIEKHGINYVSELCEKNLRGLLHILKWNKENDIYFYRITSDLLPWYTKHKISKLENSEVLYTLLGKAGEFIKRNNMRISFHPSHFVKLASDNESTVKNSLRDLEYHGDIMDYMGLEQNDYYPINIHIGAVYDGKEPTADRLVSNYDKLSKSVQERLVLENDDKSSCWGVSDLINISRRRNIPIVLDTLHHRFTDRGQSSQEAFDMARSTWETKPTIHHSNSKKQYEDGDSMRAHTDWIYEVPEVDGDYDMMIEAGKKEQAVLKYRYDYNIT